ncbi:MAG: hypothetical protein NT133_18750 [Alphaproteobacteria bacterium]|nr:hypothetical protein [Alphaproteobacteria bacterium]
MSRIYRWIYSTDRETADRRTTSLAGLAVILVILVVSMWLTKQLQRKSAIENCLMAGRINCDMLVTGQR